MRAASRDDQVDDVALARRELEFVESCELRAQLPDERAAGEVVALEDVAHLVRGDAEAVGDLALGRTSG